MARGIDHSAVADIENIRKHLRDGYGSEEAIIKELIQNADDAEAENIFFVVDEGWGGDAPHPLLTGPGLCVVNDGNIMQSDYDAMFRMGLGNRATDSRRIGRFGLGLKSVFHICDAFFIVISTNNDGDFQTETEVELLNPWKDFAHEEWNEFTNESKNALFECVKGIIKDEVDVKNNQWTAFWLPLRLNVNNAGHEIYNWWYGADYAENLELIFKNLTPSLTFLNSIKSVILVSNHKTWKLDLQADRVTSYLWVGQDEPVIEQRAVKLFRAGLVDNEFKGIKEAPNWPTVFDLDAQCDVRAKAEPEYGISIVSSSAVGVTGSLQIKVCVFLPTTEQESEIQSVAELPYDITLNLHGYYFLDADRKRVDGLENRFREGMGTNAACLEWNKELARRGMFAHLPVVVEQFAHEEQLTNRECEILWHAILNDQLLNKYRAEIEAEHKFMPVLFIDENEQPVIRWKTISAQKKIIPLLCNENDLPAAFSAFENLRELCEEFVVWPVTQGDIAGNNSEVYDRLMASARIDQENEAECRAYIHKVLDWLSRRSVDVLRGSILARPLLTIINVRNNAARHCCLNEIHQLYEEHRLINYEAGGVWDVAIQALPDWEPVFAANRPNWAGKIPCHDFASLPEIILSQRRLGPLPTRIDLILHKNMPEERSAIRYLLHGSHEMRNDVDHPIYYCAGQGGLWLQILQDAHTQADGWRFIDDNLNVFAAPTLAQWNTYPADANTVKNELLAERLIPEKIDIQPADVAMVLCNIYDQNDPDIVSKLRRMKIHPQQGVSTLISISDEQGNLLSNVFLENPAFVRDGNQNAAQIDELWNEISGDFLIISRYGQNNPCFPAQNAIFTRYDGPEPIVQELTWARVIERIIARQDAHRFWPLVMEAFAVAGGQATAGIPADDIKQCPFLVTQNEQFWSPGQVIYIAEPASVTAALEQLISVQDGIITHTQLSADVLNHRGFGSLQNYFVRLPQAIDRIGKWLEGRHDLRVGIDADLLPANDVEIDALLHDLSGQCGQHIAVAPLLTALWSIDAQRARIKQSIFPCVFQRVEVNEQEHIVAILGDLANNDQTQGHFLFLKQAVRSGFIGNIIGDLLLPHQAGDWRSTQEIIWPSDNVEPAFILRADYATALSQLQHNAAQLPMQADENNIQETDDLNESVEIMREYLQPYIDQYGPNLAAALVAVLGDNFREFAQDLLNAGLGLQVSAFRRLIVGDHALADRIMNEFELPKFRFLVSVVSGEELSQRNVAGTRDIRVPLIAHISTLLLGANLWPTFQDNREQDVHRIRLRKCDEIVLHDRNNVIALFISTINEVMFRTHVNGINDQRCNCEGYIRQITENQSDISRAQRFMLDKSESYLRELLTQNDLQGYPLLKEVIHHFEAASDHAFAAHEYRDRGLNAQADSFEKQARDERSEAQNKLREICANQVYVNIQHFLLQCVRRKMGDFQYSAESIPFELFQNADDALVEYRAAGNAINTDFKITLGKEGNTPVLEIRHCGRPINDTLGNAENGAYRQDLINMLSLNISKKGGQHDVQTTGYFGLGFKSVYFLSREPEIRSGQLAFKIVGGMYPVPLAQNGGHNHTIMRLPCVEEETGAAAVEQFRQMAPYLVYFARAVQRIRVAIYDQAWEFSRIEQQNNELTKAVSPVQIGNKRMLLFRLEQQDHAAILLELNAKGLCPLGDSIPKLWITLPTREESAMSFILNAPLRPDAGRNRLSIHSGQNQQLLEDIARSWFHQLAGIHELDDQHWEAFCVSAGFDEQHQSRYTFWESMWNLFSRGITPDVAKRNDPLFWLVWDREHGAYSRLIDNRKAIPSRLGNHFNPYRTLLSRNNIQYAIEGLLALPEVFNVFSDRQEFKDQYPVGQTVEKSVSDVLCFLSDDDTVVTPVCLSDVLHRLCPANRIEPDTANHIGKVLNKANVEEWTNQNHGNEVVELQQCFRQLTFKTEQNSYQPATDLVCGRLGNSHQEELLRAAFAPAECVLHQDYDENGIALFLLIRNKMNVDASKLSEWVGRVEDDRLQSVFRYLHKGELHEHLARNLGRNWFSSKQDTEMFSSLDTDRQQYLRWLFREPAVEHNGDDHGEGDILPLTPNAIYELWQDPANAENMMQPYVLEGDWWELLYPEIQNNNVETRQGYLRETLLDVESDEGKLLWWKVLSIVCFLSDQQRTDTIQRLWSTELNGRTFWVANEYEQNIEQIFRQILNDVRYDTKASGENAFFWRRVSYDLRKMHKLVYTFEIHKTLLEIAEQSGAGAVVNFLRSGGIAGQRNWVGIIGQSASASMFFLTRELHRLGVITGDQTYCMYVCKPVRRVAARLWWIDEGQVNNYSFANYNAVSEAVSNGIMGYDKNMMKYYDIPLLLYDRGGNGIN
jgi:hypothetical protein